MDQTSQATTTSGDCGFAGVSQTSRGSCGGGALPRDLVGTSYTRGAPFLRALCAEVGFHDRCELRPFALVNIKIGAPRYPIITLFPSHHHRHLAATSAKILRECELKSRAPSPETGFSNL